MNEFIASSDESRSVSKRLLELFGFQSARRVERYECRACQRLHVLSDLFILHGVPRHIRADTGPAFVAEALQQRMSAVGAKTTYIMPGSA